MEAEHDFFSCRKCHYSERAVIAEHLTCTHPCIKSAKLVGKGRDTFTKVDWSKVNLIVNKILDLQFTMVDGHLSNFDFPFRYDPVWITGCKGFKESEHAKGFDHVHQKGYGSETWINEKPL